MPRNDWYRRTNWTLRSSTEFENKLSRSRGSRSEYLRIQALTLASTRKRKLADPAIHLAERFLEENPGGLFRAQAYSTLALAYSTLGKRTEAIDAHRSAMEAEIAQPNVRGYCYLDFAWFVAFQNLTDLYDEATDALSAGFNERDLIFPVNQFRYFGALAIFAEHGENTAKVHRLASSALDAAAASVGPFSRHPSLGVVVRCDRKILRRLKRMLG